MRADGGGSGSAGGPADGAGPGGSPRTRFVEQVVFLCVAGLLFLWVAWEARTFPDRSRIFPQVVAAAAFLLTLLGLARDARAGVDPEVHGGTPFVARMRAAVPYLLWIGGYYVALWLLGFPVATALFVFAFLRVEGEMGNVRAAVGVALLLGVFGLLWWALELYWPVGLLPGVLGVGGA